MLKGLCRLPASRSVLLLGPQRVPALLERALGRGSWATLATHSAAEGAGEVGNVQQAAVDVSEHRPQRAQPPRGQATHTLKSGFLEFHHVLMP